jgi:hypothetical protein
LTIKEINDLFTKIKNKTSFLGELLLRVKKELTELNKKEILFLENEESLLDAILMDIIIDRTIRDSKKDHLPFFNEESETKSLLYLDVFLIELERSIGGLINAMIDFKYKCKLHTFYALVGLRSELRKIMDLIEEELVKSHSAFLIEK